MKEYVKAISFKSPTGVPLHLPECCNDCHKIVCDFPCRKYWFALKNSGVKLSSVEIDRGVHTYEYVFRYITVWILIGLVAWLFWLLAPRSNNLAIVASHRDQRLQNETILVSVQGDTNLVNAAEGSILKIRGINE